LLKGQPNGIFDIHRDGIPDPDEYRTTVGNQEMSMVRLLVGKSNQNKDANMAFAKQIKAIGDKVYPGLIKDIYIGGARA
ncbi:MAG: stage II sporulation protein P, partial [Clostridia bacterium]|nr:stage II sporulation protein P [Clostridia bacterium]